MIKDIQIKKIIKHYRKAGNVFFLSIRTIYMIKQLNHWSFALMVYVYEGVVYIWVHIHVYDRMTNVFKQKKRNYAFDSFHAQYITIRIYVGLTKNNFKFFIYFKNKSYFWFEQTYRPFRIVFPYFAYIQ